ncbi:MAG: COQ9 family protein [Marinicaulis sp.]|nr:COQ9 family protein [Marinicaulis sp.]
MRRIPKASGSVYITRTKFASLIYMTHSEKNNEKTDDYDGFSEPRAKILDEMLKKAVFDGWSRRALNDAARDVGVDSATLKAAFPKGVSDVLRYWSSETDAVVLAAMNDEEFDALKIREKVAFGVQTRLYKLRPHKEAVRRAAAFLALPLNGKLAAELTWNIADTIWRGLGDKSTDFNYYSKRTILSGVWTSTFARWLADDSEDQAATKAFLDARIENVMQIEKVKSRAKKLGIDPTAPIGFFAKLRYGAR